MEIRRYLIGNDWDTGPCVQQRKMWIFSEMSNMGFHLENGGIRGDLLVSDNFLNRRIKPTLLLLLISFQSKMRGKISTPSAKAGTTTPFAFGSGLKSRERIDGLRNRNVTNNMVRNVGFDALKRIPICTFC
jgi:hypothetical protein